MAAFDNQLDNRIVNNAPVPASLTQNQFPASILKSAAFPVTKSYPYDIVNNFF